VSEPVPVVKIDRVPIASIPSDLGDDTAPLLQEDLSNQIVEHAATGVIIDISALDIVDTFIARMLATMASISRALDALTIVVGMRVDISTGADVVRVRQSARVRASGGTLDRRSNQNHHRDKRTCAQRPHARRHGHRTDCPRRRKWTRRRSCCSISTAGGLGLGLPGSRQLVDLFALYSDARGTRVTVTKWKR